MTAMRIIFLIMCLSGNLFSQDKYQTELADYLNTTYQISGGKYVLYDNEKDMSDNHGVYGAITFTKATVTNFSYTIQHSLTVNTVGANPWDAGINVKNKLALAKDDIVMMVFWAKRNGTNSELFIFEEDATNYEKELYQKVNLTPDWNQYFVPVKMSKAYGISRLAIGIHMASQKQSFELAGFTLLNFGKTFAIDKFPSSFFTGAYEGIEENAPWRAAANARIDSIRKSDLKLNIVDKQGNPVSGANVAIDMEAHQFEFGSAFVSCRMPGNNCYDATYVEKMTNLDGKNHGFNAGVTENDLKWDAWEEKWFGTNAEIKNAVKFMTEKGIKMRGHTLIWPGFDLMPDDIKANRTNLTYVRDRFKSRINTMLKDTLLKKYITDWDVINELTQNRDVENMFKADPNFTTGREIYKEIFKLVKEADPTLVRYINEYVVESGGGSSQSVIDRYKLYLDELYNSDVPFNGIGFQAHIGSQPTSIVKLEEIFNEFSQRYNSRIKVTEYDISGNVSPTIQAKYMSDILTLTFSHPAADAFLMWGFWDGNHWKGNAPIYNMDWSLKPSGQAFIDKLFKDWWTNDTAITTATGEVKFRPFKGKHKITVTKDGKSQTFPISLGKDLDRDLVVDFTSASNDENITGISVFPNPTDGILYINNDKQTKLDINVMSIDGSLIKTIQSSDKLIHFDTSDIRQSMIILSINSETSLPVTIKVVLTK
jgi:endo-1,4-beta-xylanase